MDSKLADAAIKLLELLTWKRIALVFVIWISTGVSVLFWLNRDYLSGKIRPQTISTEKPPLVVSDKAKAIIEETLKRSAYLINTISVVSVDMERNVRRVIYFTTNDIEIERQNAEFVRTHATEDIPLFVPDDIENNKRIIRMINGEIVCTEFANTAAAKYLKNVNAKYACSTGVPPYYGKFRGTILVFLKVVPSEEETGRLRILMRELADKLDNPSDKSAK